MRKVKILFWGVFALFLTFCSLVNDGKNTQNVDAIVGTWNWQQSSGGISGNDIVTPESTGVNKKLVFNTNKKVTVFTNDVETGSYTYTIKMGNSIFDNKQHYLLTFNEMCYVIQYIDSQHLSIQDNFADGYVLTYTK
ncbi:hypothetical protein EOD40_15865 [Flavobacterium sufflavum]|uniref:Lipocalin-like domain-containing protein n=1 Tax=Flavobacterium sufflavum TaxID=1921138 RepID=A0A437KML5_9FLAO|nr:hypothetical protein [Flavobacterium sufflavum]RVT72273.1 hypothetical protein EOD40_15865 [Flavobacterium sufflavum]